ncbi:MAG: efflux RND transporter periplasmic adaptor subunit [Oribacterium sp.]|uniref:efflux RND transporter periplasmic adaptor subunit n=1 Tax=Oribacterium sp. Sow4_G1_1 TaxID=3438794 RepID=UPI002A77BED9|nr:efflux RND transporter periplasmic adaptor subunit [Oribacterium sp.]MDD6520139.1 efflux RND transporter periplasmic adaptor subunit [Oribacterium sp.]MDY2855002.1 efflux RND transporter periplasmic adaptor subunit [Oliverpabstia sp.]
MKKQVKIAIGAVIVLGFAGLVATRMMKPQEEMQTKGLPAVTLTTATEGSIEQTTALMGTVQPSDTYYITPKVAGELVEIYVQNGQSVEEGAPIAKIDNQKQIDAAKSQMEAANASVQAASQQAATAQDAVNRMTPLYESGDISVQSYNQTANSAKAAASQVDAAKAQAASAKLNYETQVEFATVTAPAAGVVQNQNMTLHGMVSQSSQLCVITGTGAKVVKFNVTEDVLQNLTLGQTVTVEKNGSSYSGTVTKLTKLVDPQSGLFPVEATLSGADALSDGSSTKLSLVAAKADHALLVPVDAVYYSGGNPYVYTYENGLVKRVFITTGISDDQYYEVTDGLDGTEQIVNSWTDDIYDGAEVRIVDANGQTTEDASTGAETEETHAAD